MWVCVSVCECEYQCVWIGWVCVSVWICVSVCECVSECVWVWVCEYVWVCKCVWVCVTGMSEWVEWVGGWMDGWVSEWMNEWVSDIWHEKDYSFLSPTLSEHHVQWAHWSQWCRGWWLQGTHSSGAALSNTVTSAISRTATTGAFTRCLQLLWFSFGCSTLVISFL